jgi:hypothetical protein
MLDVEYKGWLIEPHRTSQNVIVGVPQQWSPSTRATVWPLTWFNAMYDTEADVVFLESGEQPSFAACHWRLLELE